MPRPSAAALERLSFTRLDAGRLLRAARERAELSQAELAHRIGTTQAAVSRWERGVDEPRLSTVGRALRACGLEADLLFRAIDDVDRAQIAMHLAMSPLDRVQSLRNMHRFVTSARRAVPVGAAQP
jgi:transcriptional regulator with XRE-family HTH domain